MANQMTFPGTPNVSWVDIPATSQNTAKDGTGTLGTNIFSAFTAHATNGSRIRSLKFAPKGTNVATVIRVFINNGSTNGTAANNSLIAEATAPASTLSEVSQLGAIEIPLNIDLPAGYRLLVTYGTSVAAGFACSAFGWDF